MKKSAQTKENSEIPSCKRAAGCSLLLWNRAVSEYDTCTAVTQGDEEFLEFAAD